MRIAILSDVHANLPALEAVLADIESAGVDALNGLGDLVGYAPWPNEVLEGLRDANDVERAAEAILASELPAEFASQLREARGYLSPVSG